MTLLQQANQALRTQQYGTALDLYLEVLRESAVPAAVVHSNLSLLERRLRASQDPAHKSRLGQLQAALAASPVNPTMEQAVPLIADHDDPIVQAAQHWAKWLQSHCCTNGDPKHSKLDVSSLVEASRALFQADNFPLAQQALEQALAQDPSNLEARRAQKNQYYYHAYSDWLMQTTEGRGDWYQADGLSERPDWKTAVDLCRLYIDQPRDAIAPHDLRQWTQAGLLWAEEHWDRQDSARASAILRDTLAPLTAAAPPAFTRALLEAVQAARATAKGDPEAAPSATTEALRASLAGLDPAHYSVPEWLCLYDALNWNGLLQLGYLAREQAVQRAFADADAPSASPACVQQGVRAALDQADLARAAAYLDRLTAALPPAAQPAPQVAELRALHALFSGDLARFRTLWPHPPRPVDQRFRDYLRGKSVAVVGPAPTGSADGAEIDGFDVVVRMNWRGPESLPEVAEFGSKTHVALYNAHTVRLLSAEGRLGLVKALDFCLIRRARYDLDRLPWEAGRVRMLAEYPGAFYKSLNAVPAVLFDLLLHGAERIKLFKVNFYLGERQHAQGYRGRADEKLAEMPLRRLQPVMGNHELIVQMDLVRLFNRSGWITVEPGMRALFGHLGKNYLEEYEQRIAAVHLKLEKVIANAENLMAERDWVKAIKAWEGIFQQKIPIPRHCYEKYARSLRVLGNFAKADAVIQRGIIAQPNEVKLYESFSRNAFDAKDWTSLIFRSHLLMKKAEKIRNIAIKESLIKTATRNIAIGYGNLNETKESARFVLQYIDQSKDSLWLSSNINPVANINSKAFSEQTKSASFLLLFDDDSTLYTMADFAVHLRKNNCKVKYMQIKHLSGSRISERQLQLVLPDEQVGVAKFEEMTSNIYNNAFAMKFNGIAAAKPLPYSQNFLRTKKRPAVISLYMGVDFFPTTGVLNRLNSDIICFVSHSDRNLFREIIPYSIQSSKGQIVYSPKFYFPRKLQNLMPKPEVNNVYFLMQAIVPLKYTSRLHYLKIINKTARRHPDKKIIIKLRHLETENKAHMHPEQFPYERLAKEIDLEKNILFSSESMRDVLENADLCVTCSSTAGIEAAAQGIPTLFWLDYPDAESDPLTEKSRELFANCGMLGTEHDIVSLNVKKPRQCWLNNFLPEANPLGKLVGYIS